MTSTLRKLRTVREGPVNPPGLSVSAKREVCPPQRLTTDAEAIEREYDQSDAAILGVMRQAELDWLPTLELGDWREFGAEVTDSLQVRLRPGPKPLVNPLGNADPVSTDSGYATIVVRKLGILVYRTEVVRAFAALRCAYRDAVDIHAARSRLTNASPIAYLGLPDVIEGKLGWRDIRTIGDLVKWSPNDLLDKSHIHEPYLSATELDIVVGVLSGLGWRLARNRQVRQGAIECHG